MLHYLVTGEKIDVSAVQYQLGELTPDSAFPRISTRKPPKDRIQIYRAERALLNAVRDGDLDGAAAMANAADVARVRQYTDNPLRNAQIACTTFAAVCTRAAIEGGLSTTMSYCLGDAYIKSFFAAKSLSEVADIKTRCIWILSAMCVLAAAILNIPKWCKEAVIILSCICVNR